MIIAIPINILKNSNVVDHLNPSITDVELKIVEKIKIKYAFYPLKIYLKMKLKTQIELYFAQQNESSKYFMNQLILWFILFLAIYIFNFSSRNFFVTSSGLHPVA